MKNTELKTLMNHPDYYNRYEREKNWDYIGIISGRAMQGAEANEMQHILEEKVKSLGNALYVDGTIVEGCEITLDTSLKVAHLAGGRVFIDGLVHDVKPATLNIPDAETVQVGIWKKSRAVTEHEDPTLLNPAKNMPMYRMPGGYRIVTTAEWGLNLDNLHSPFYPIYSISGGEIVSQVIKEKNQDYMDALARYDRDSHGHYVVEGLYVTALPNAKAEDNGKKQTYSIAQGLAHIRGYEARLTHAVRLVVSEEADLYDVTSEAHQFDSGGTGSATVPVHQTPIEDVKSVRVTKEKTVELTHGNYTGASDNLPDTSVIKLVEVKQGGTTFTQGSDYRLDANKVNWEAEGLEPAPGSKYTVKYHYRTNIVPDASSPTDITLSGLVEGSLIELDYTYRMPRRDIIVMYRDRSVTMVKGVPHRYAAVLPDTPPDAICLATVEQTWVGLPIVRNVAVQAVRMDDLQRMRAAQRDLYSLVARQEMRVDAMLSAPTSAFGVFVDPLFDNDMRDKGTPQTALVAGQMLQLPMEVAMHSMDTGTERALDYTPEVLVDQPMHTKSMKVNPYMAFEPMPAQVVLTPAIDRWTEDVHLSFVSGIDRTDVSLAENVTGTLREIDVKITGRGFGYGEPIKVFFDGIEVNCTATASDSEGKFEGTIRIPKGVPTGVKLVRLQGTHTIGEATFIGIRNVRTTTTYFIPRRVDPLAQTFTLSENRHAAGMDFWLAKKGVSAIRLEIRETQLGFPTQTTLATCRIAPSELNEEAWNRAFFEVPVYLTAGVEYALVLLADTADHEVGITELGDWDPETGWIRSQRYQTGVLLSSSNASTWTDHQSADLAFRLLGAKFKAEVKKVELGTIDLTGVTDLLPLAEVQRTGSTTDVTFVVSKGGAEVARMQAGQALPFEAALEGEHEVRAELFGDEKCSPILGRDPQLVTGKIGTTGDYISRAFKCGAGKKIMVTTEEFVPSGATVEVFVQTATDVWTKGDVSEEEPVGSGWHRRHRFVPCGAAVTKIKIVLTGSAAARPRVREISGVVLSA